MIDIHESPLLRDDPQSVEVGDVITKSFELIKEHPAELIGLTFVGALGVGAINLVVEGIKTAGLMMVGSGAQSTMGPEAAAATVGLLSTITGVLSQGLMTVISSALSAAFIIMWLRLIRGQRFSLDCLTEAKRFILPLLLIQFATQFAVSAGTLACIVPGFILAFGLMLANMIAVDHGFSPLDAMASSWELTNGRKIDLFILSLCLGLLNIGGMLACGVGLLVTIPISAGGLCFFYDAIAERGDNYLTPDERAANDPYSDESGW